MKRRCVFLVMTALLIMCLPGCGKDTQTDIVIEEAEAGGNETADGADQAEAAGNEAADVADQAEAAGNEAADGADQAEVTDMENTNDHAEYYLNPDGVLVDRVEEFEIQTFGEYELKIPILSDGGDEVVVYEFDTYDNVHVVLDAANVYQQTSLDEAGDYGDVQLEQIAPGKDIAYLFDGERYYIEDYTINLLTISKPVNN